MAKSKSKSNPNQVNVLLVEDDPVDQMAFARYVVREHLPYNYCIAGSVEEARELLHSKEFDIIIVDFQLGDGTSLELFPLMKEVPVLVVTGTGSEEVAVQAMKRGAVDYIIKDPEGHYLKVLPETVRNALERQKEQQELERYRHHLEQMVLDRTHELQGEIKEREKFEQQLKQSLKEKEILLKEVHHRVKNNLAVISGLLSLQAHSGKDPAVKKAFEDSKSRIRSMSLVHDKLYRSGNLAEVEFGDYIRSLIRGFSLSIYPGKEGLEHIDSLFDIRVDNISLGIDNAIPCGMIANELLTNCVKHAFPGGLTAEKRIVVRFSRKENSYILGIRDNGIGLPEQVDIKEAESFGLHLVRILTSQLEGVFEQEIIKGTGTSLKITFPAP